MATTTATIDRTMGLTEWLLLVALATLWGGSFFFAEVALAELPPLSVVLGRVSLAAVTLLLAVRLLGLPLPARPGPWFAFAGMGLLNNLIPFGLIFWGQTTIASGLASILNAATPIFTVLLAHLLTADEKLSWNRLAGVLCGAAGVAVMMGPALLGEFGDALWAQLAVLGGALSYAFAGIYGRRFAGLPPLVTATGQVTTSTLLLAPVVLIVDRPWNLAMPGPATWGALAGIAVLCTALAYFIYFRILARAGATNLLLVTLLIPVSAVTLGTLILGERLSAGQIAGAALIGFGLVVLDGRLLRPTSRAGGRRGPS